MKQKEETALKEISNAERYAKKSEGEGLERSLSAALKQKNEKGFLTAIVCFIAVIALLLISAIADILTLCFEVHRILGWVVSAVALVLILVFVVRPVVKVLSARFFVVDVTAEGKDLAKRRNAKALKEVAKSLVAYNTDPKNTRYRYLSDETVAALSNALSSGDKILLRNTLKKAYAGEIAKFANGLIFQCAGKTFLRTSISQNDKIDALSVLLTNLSLVKLLVAVYGYRPSYAKLFKIYLTVFTHALVAYGMENVNWCNAFGKFFSGVAKKIPFLDTLVDSAVQGTVSAFLTLLVGYKTKRYLFSDYKAQEKTDMTGGVDVADDEARIASALAGKIRKEKANVDLEGGAQ